MERFAALMFLGLLSGAATQTTLTGVTMFNCMRAGVTCTGGICDAAGTACDCTAGSTAVEALHCVTDADVTTTCGDTSKCGTTGTCYVSNGVDTCYCDQLHYGSSCENSRVELTCGADEMTVSVTPHGAFVGNIYAEGQSAVAACQLPDDTSGNFVSTFNFDTVDASNCGVTKADLLDGSSVKIGNQYSVKMVVQYTTGFLLGTDQELTVSCHFPDEATVTGVVFETDANNNLDTGDGTAEGSPVVFAIADASDVALTAAQLVNVGDELNVKITMQTNDVYTSFRVDECIATNNLADTHADYATLNFVDDGGCPSDSKVVRGDHTAAVGATGETVTMPLYAFMFVKGSSANKNDLFFSCTVQLCDASTAADCALPTCSNNLAVATTGRRRRRAADESVITLGQGLIVRFGNTTLEETTTESAAGGSQPASKTEECLRNPELQTIIAVLGFSLLLLFISVGVLAFLLCRRRSGRRHHQKFVDDGLSMGSSTQTLHLPRPCV